MKTKIIIILFFAFNLCQAQLFNISGTGDHANSTQISNATPNVNVNAPAGTGAQLGQNPTSFDIQYISGGTLPFRVVYNGNSIATISDGNWTSTITIPLGGASLFGSQIDITDNVGNSVFSFILSNANPVGAAVAVPNPTPPTPPAPQVLSLAAIFGTTFPEIKATSYGLTIERGNTRYTGNEYTHIFLDQFGNLIYGSIPQGISNRNYVVHVLYLAPSSNRNAIYYSIEQTKGQFSDILSIRGDGSLNEVELQNEGLQFDSWTHQEFLLRPSTSEDITFEIYRNFIDPSTPMINDQTKMATHSIKMSRVYHGSLDIGILSTTLANPTYNLVALPSDPTQLTIKETNTGNSGVFTAMYTFYTSPIVLFRAAINKDYRKELPKYKYTGRSFLDDHEWFERIYPAVGVGLNDNILENLFYGFNLEVARGGSVFVGWHYGKVNTFDYPGNFNPGVTSITESEFNYRTNSSWQTNFAVGANLDLRIVMNLFRQNQ